MAVYRLRGCVQHYAWGGTQYLPDLLQSENPQQEPWAEYWLGIHPKGPAQVLLPEGEMRLDEFLDQHPEILQGGVSSEFARLPFLLKILDVRSMLSIQLHPNRERARAGYEREEALGIPRLAPHRSYKDENHKPEVMVALSDFWLLHGFRAEAEIKQTLEEIPAWQSLQSVMEEGGIPALYRTVMEASQSEIDAWLKPLYEDLRQRNDLSENQAEYWAWQAFEQYTRDGHFDRGIFSIYWFNLVKVKAGEGIFQDAGVPHAYLRGVNVELMANSDNVLRGGLTPKHIDVPELLANIHAESVHPQIISGEELATGVRQYPVPVPDFQLSRVLITPGQQISLQNPRAAITLVLAGKIEINGDIYVSGDAFLQAAKKTVVLVNTGVEPTILYSATF